jgi:hypothetical protein
VTKVSELITKVRILSQDQLAPYRHSDPELFGWLTDAERAVVILIPDSNTKLLEVTPVADQTEQDISTLGHLLVDVISNKSTGKTVRRADMSSMDDFVPSWRVESAGPDPESWITNPGSPTAFWLYPMPDASVKLQVLIAQTPVAITTPEQTLTIAGVYDSALLNYVLARTFEVDNDLDSAMLHAQSFATELGVTSQVIADVKQ